MSAPDAPPFDEAGVHRGTRRRWQWISATLVHVATRNITLSLDDELIRQAKVLAAERDTSVSALVAMLLRQILGDTPDFDRLWAEEEATMASGLLEVGPITWTRDELHRR